MTQYRCGAQTNVHTYIIMHRFPLFPFAWSSFSCRRHAARSAQRADSRPPSPDHAPAPRRATPHSTDTHQSREAANPLILPACGCPECVGRSSRWQRRRGFSLSAASRCSRIGGRRQRGGGATPADTRHTRRTRIDSEHANHRRTRGEHADSVHRSSGSREATRHSIPFDCD